MKERILNGWTIKRALYIVMGFWIVIESIAQNQWMFVLLGIYFAAMGILAFGCAAGNCSGNNCGIESGQKNNKRRRK